MTSLVLELSAFLAVTFFVVSHCNQRPAIEWNGIQPKRSVEIENKKIRVFATVSGVDLQGCIDNCQRRKVCQYINYHTSAHVCFLIEKLTGRTSTGNTSTSKTKEIKVNDDPHFVFGQKSEWVEENWGHKYSVCNQCLERQLCTIEDDGGVNCTFNECPAPPVVDDAELLGNKYTIGSRLRYRCTDNNTRKSDGIVCQPNGTWSTVDFTCQEMCPCNLTIPTEQTNCPAKLLPTPTDGTTFQIMIVKKKVKRTQAIRCCKNAGWNLVQILNNTVAKMEFLQGHLKTEGEDLDYLVDAQRVNKDSPWQTKDGQAVLDNASYWKPDSKNKDFTCAQLRKEKKQEYMYKLNDCRCNINSAFLCER